MTPHRPHLPSVGSSAWKAAATLMSRKELRPVVRTLSDLHVRLYRRTGGRAAAPQYPTMLLTVVGRRSGQPRTVPLVYARDGDDLVIAAAYAGSERDPDWWLNLRDTPDAEVELARERRPVRAELVPASPERDRLWAALAATYPPFEEYRSRTSREIPVVRLRPRD